MFDFHLRDIYAEVAQPGRALDSTLFVFGGEAEDRVVAGSNPALGTTQNYQKRRWVSFRYLDAANSVFFSAVFLWLYFYVQAIGFLGMAGLFIVEMNVVSSRENHLESLHFWLMISQALKELFREKSLS